MFNRETIRNIVQELVEKYDTNNPIEIAEQLDIIVIKEKKLIDCKGFYQYINQYSIKDKFIYVSCDLSEHSKVETCSHELGHAILHTELNAIFLNSNTHFVAERFEKEANIFAAELLLYNVTKDDICDMTIDQIAATYEIDKKLVKLKFKNEFE